MVRVTDAVGTQWINLGPDDVINDTDRIYVTGCAIPILDCVITDDVQKVASDLAGFGASFLVGQTIKSVIAHLQASVLGSYQIAVLRQDQGQVVSTPPGRIRHKCASTGVWYAELQDHEIVEVDDFPWAAAPQSWPIPVASDMNVPYAMSKRAVRHGFIWASGFAASVWRAWLQGTEAVAGYRTLITGWHFFRQEHKLPPAGGATVGFALNQPITLRLAAGQVPDFSFEFTTPLKPLLREDKCRAPGCGKMKDVGKSCWACGCDPTGRPPGR